MGPCVPLQALSRMRITHVRKFWAFLAMSRLGSGEVALAGSTLLLPHHVLMGFILSVCQRPTGPCLQRGTTPSFFSFSRSLPGDTSGPGLPHPWALGGDGHTDPATLRRQGRKTLSCLFPAAENTAGTSYTKASASHSSPLPSPAGPTNSRPHRPCTSRVG